MTREELEAIKRRQKELKATEKERGLTFIEASEALNLAVREFGFELAIVLKLYEITDFLTCQIKKRRWFYRLLGGK